MISTPAILDLDGEDIVLVRAIPFDTRHLTAFAVAKLLADTECGSDKDKDMDTAKNQGANGQMAATWQKTTANKKAVDPKNQRLFKNFGGDRWI